MASKSTVEETADERLDRLIAQEREAVARRMRSSSSGQPAVRSVRVEGEERRQVEENPGRGRLEEFTMTGLSPDQQTWLRQAAEQMRVGGLRRPEFLPVPLAVEDLGGPGGARGDDPGHRDGGDGGQGVGREVEARPDRANGQGPVGGEMLGVLATPLPAYTGGQESGYRSAGEGVVTALFQDGGGRQDGEGRGPQQLPEGLPGTTEVPVNPFWSENVKKELGHYGEEGRGVEVAPDVPVVETSAGARASAVLHDPWWPE